MDLHRIFLLGALHFAIVVTTDMLVRIVWIVRGTPVVRQVTRTTNFFAASASAARFAYREAEAELIPRPRGSRTFGCHDWIFDMQPCATSKISGIAF